MYQLDKQAAMNADSTGKWLTETGKYIGKILCAEDIKASSGTRGIALTLQAQDGRETRQFIYTVKTDGTQLSGYDLVMALMTCLKLRDIKPVTGTVKRWNKDTRQEYQEQATVFQELAGKPIGFLLQKTEEESRKNPGETAWTAKLVGVFEAGTELMASEILTGKKQPEALALRVAQLADRPLKKRTGTTSAHDYAPAGGDSFQDADIPF
ncbi:hypothetical protein CURE108131_23005 [Cupriavidus respiraculi]|uniref:Single-stranded DNA-binding protein n=1 Tax=Cupriavidus respiraculi TaxID=195930 RepID=A0ABN7YJH0_9BURK|nr:hypothetical protein [Cupriavidus respiraculi]CAG9172501.1 hypothetical protein LMG21510_01994 [Cupriavidus respiraculi]